MTTTGRLRPPVAVLLLVHAFPVAITLLLLWFVVPVFGEMFADFGAALPGLTQVMLNISAWSRHFAPVTLLVVAAFLAGDALFYAWLCRNAGRQAGLAWFWAILIALFFPIPLIIVTMFLPVFRMGEIVE
ncbi:MAG: hypothetical protein HQ559_12200 [Lentisphaerae bacterium]|nr:hypothetical protein [Lentisphaerota bacterium]